MTDRRILIDPDSGDYEDRMKAACARAEWELGDKSWAGVIVGAFLYHKLDAEALELEKAE